MSFIFCSYIFFTRANSTGLKVHLKTKPAQTAHVSSSRYSNRNSIYSWRLEECKGSVLKIAIFLLLSLRILKKISFRCFFEYLSDNLIVCELLSVYFLFSVSLVVCFQSGKRRNETMYFYQLLNETKDCFEKHRYVSIMETVL